ncbi:MAG: glycosyltransferase [Rhodoglobus sp.]
MNASRRMRAPVSIVCVFNDPDVLESCLTRSVVAGLSDAPQTEFLPVDNRNGEFSSAGAALNHGARLARNSVVVFVHQDVILHSLAELEKAADILCNDPQIGVIGAVGIDSRRRIVGRMRDRVIHIGESAPTPRDVDSLDEVLFMVQRELVLSSPLTEDPLLAWHAYGVEFAARVRRDGMRATAMDLAITHNSLTTNLAHLDLAHRKVGDDYPELLPIRTTCGTVHKSDGPGGLSRALRRARGAAIWWSESVEARAIGRESHERVILADIRLVIDDALRHGKKRSLRVVDVASTPQNSVNRLARFDRDFEVTAATIAAVPKIITDRPADQALLITGISRADVAQLRVPEGVPRTVGLWRDTGLWVLVGIESEALMPLWSTARNRPFAGMLPHRAVNAQAD